MNRLLISSAVIAATILSPIAQASAETLTDALAVAYRTNPTIRAERAQFRATRELKAQAWAGALPQVSASASIEQNNTTNTSLFNTPTDASGNPILGADGLPLPPEPQSVEFTPITAGVSAEQPVFTGLRNLNAIRQAKARVRAGGARLVSVEQQVLQQAATAYFDVLRDSQVYDANLGNVKVLLRQQDEAALRFEVGEITKTDVAQAEARLAGARSQLAAAQAQLAVSRSVYRQMIGEMPGTLDDDPALPDVPETEEQAQNFAKVFAPAIVSATETEEASRRQVSIAKGVLLPSVSLTARYQYAEDPNFFVQNDEQFVYGAQASIPIFQGGLNYSRIREAKALNDADRRRIEEAERQVSAAVSGAWEQLQAARVTIASARAQVEANTLALEGVRRENQVGARTTLDVLNAEQELLNANVSLANAERDERAAVFSLLASAGLLTPEAAGLTVDEGGADGAAVNDAAEVVQ
ncbi:MAG: TolC family outer membrane protein [Pseudomonadota bacterium]